MNTQTKVLLLIGSPKTQSTSASLGTHLLGLLRQRGLATETVHITSALRSPEAEAGLLQAVDDADLIAVAFPLYVDSLPSPLVRAFEVIAIHRRKMELTRPQRPLAIANCGFPEAHHNDTALAQCRLFCRDTGIEWVGGLGLGGGGMIAGLPLEKRGRAVKNVIKALDLAADSLAADRPLRPEAVSLMARPLIPTWLYIFVGHYGWRRTAKHFGALKKFYDKPYERAS